MKEEKEAGTDDTAGGSTKMPATWQFLSVCFAYHPSLPLLKTLASAEPKDRKEGGAGHFSPFFLSFCPTSTAGRREKRRRNLKGPRGTSVFPPFLVQFVLSLSHSSVPSSSHLNSEGEEEEKQEEEDVSSPPSPSSTFNL